MTLVQINQIQVEREMSTNDALLIQAMTADTKMRGCEFTAVTPMVATPFGHYFIIIDSHDCPAGR